jgi:hypothetical protein
MQKEGVMEDDTFDICDIYKAAHQNAKRHRPINLFVTVVAIKQPKLRKYRKMTKKVHGVLFDFQLIGNQKKT